jgi:hypothetical protein
MLAHSPEAAAARTIPLLSIGALVVLLARCAPAAQPQYQTVRNLTSQECSALQAVIEERERYGIIATSRDLDEDALRRCGLPHSSGGGPPYTRTPPATSGAPIAVATAQKRETFRTEIEKIVNNCKEKRLSGEVKGFVGSVNCSNPLIRNAALKANYPYMDLIELYLAKKLQLAERVDARIMTEGDMQVALAQVLVDITDQERQRNQVARENQQRDAAASAQLKAQQDAADAAKTNLYLNMIGQGLGMMSGR